VQQVRALLDVMALERTAPEIRIPVLLVYGAADALVPVEQGRRLRARIPAARLLEVAGASHWSVPWTDAAVRAAVEWFAARASAGVGVA
jgi:pimeloyl-ACP methyl ester carboxylesterase